MVCQSNVTAGRIRGSESCHLIGVVQRCPCLRRGRQKPSRDQARSRFRNGLTSGEIDRPAGRCQVTHIECHIPMGRDSH